MRSLETKPNHCLLSTANVLQVAAASILLGKSICSKPELVGKIDHVSGSQMIMIGRQDCLKGQFERKPEIYFKEADKDV